VPHVDREAALPHRVVGCEAAHADRHVPGLERLVRGHRRQHVIATRRRRPLVGQDQAVDRVRAMHLDRRLPLDQLAIAAHAGLQDSAPRAALFSLHARVVGVGPDSWQDASLAQVWGPRLAAYVVPADAVATFTLGLLPRDREQRARIVGLSDRVLAVLDGSPMRSNRLFAAFGDLRNPGLVRAASAAGRFVIRWDARTTTVIPIAPPAVDEEDARVDLARRYVAWFGAAGGAARFARWAGIGLADATKTWATLAPVAWTRDRGAVRGVRFLPLGDPFLFGPGRPEVEAREIPGVVLVDGRRAGTWARQRHHVTVRPSPRLSAAEIDRVTTAAQELSGPLGRAVRVTVATAD
jgi:hypothetical protein